MSAICARITRSGCDISFLLQQSKRHGQQSIVSVLRRYIHVAYATTSSRRSVCLASVGTTFQPLSNAEKPQILCHILSDARSNVSASPYTSTHTQRVRRYTRWAKSDTLLVLYFLPLLMHGYIDIFAFCFVYLWIIFIKWRRSSSADVNKFSFMRISQSINRDYVTMAGLTYDNTVIHILRVEKHWGSKTL